jgi:hypothetical protein
MEIEPSLVPLEGLPINPISTAAARACLSGMNKGHWNKLRQPYDHRPQQRLTRRNPRPHESIEQYRWETSQLLQTQKVRIDCIRRVKLIGQKEVHGRERTGAAVPQ